MAKKKPAFVSFQPPEERPALDVQARVDAVNATRPEPVAEPVEPAEPEPEPEPEPALVTGHPAHVPPPAYPRSTPDGVIVHWGPGGPPQS
jgi:hypothetical protein